MVAMPAGDTAFTSPSTITQVPRISSTCPGTRGAQFVEELGVRIPVVGGAVQLHRDALARDTALHQIVQHLARRLGPRRPFLGEARSAQGSGRLRSTRNDAGLAECAEEIVR